MTVPYLYTTSTGSGDYYVGGSHAFSGAVLPKQWYYLVVSRVSGTTKAFLNGTEVMSFADSSNYIAGRLTLGVNNGGGTAYYFNGYISNFKVVIGTGTTSGTSPASPATATSGTQALLNFTNAAIVDLSTRNVLETVGNTQANTSVKKYGTGSLAFDGNGDYLKSNPTTTSLYTFGTGNFTVEGWFYVNSLPGTDMVLYDGRPTNGAYPCIILQGSTSKLLWYVDSSIRITSTNVVSTGVWFHLAITRDGTSTKMFVGGIQSGSTYTDSTNYLGSATRPFIGANATNGTESFNGNIDDLRITKGYARYTTTFTPPTGAVPRR